MHVKYLIYSNWSWYFLCTVLPVIIYSALSKVALFKQAIVIKFNNSRNLTRDLVNENIFYSAVHPLCVNQKSGICRKLPRLMKINSQNQITGSDISLKVPLYEFI